MKVNGFLGELVVQSTTTVANGRCSEDAVDGVIVGFHHAGEESKIIASH